MLRPNCVESTGSILITKFYVDMKYQADEIHFSSASDYGVFLCQWLKIEIHFVRGAKYNFPEFAIAQIYKMIATSTKINKSSIKLDLGKSTLYHSNYYSLNIS